MRAALAIAGCDGLEFDVRGSADGVPIVLHDETLARVQGRPDAAASVTAAELAALGVPSLAEVLAIAGPQAFLDVELKGSPVPDTIAVLEAARATVGGPGPAPGGGSPAGSRPGDGPGPAPAGELLGVVVSSFEAATLRWLGDERPGWARWLNAETLDQATIRLALGLGCSGIAALAGAITSATALAASEAGLALAAWTVTTRRELNRLEDLGVVAACVEGDALDG